MAKNKIFLTVAILASSEEPKSLYLGFDGDAARQAYTQARNSADPDVQEIRLIGQDYGVQKRWKAHSAAPTSEDDGAESTPEKSTPKPTAKPARGPKPKKAPASSGEAPAAPKSSGEEAPAPAPESSGDPSETGTPVS